jgi:hypothetical protein
MKTMKIVRGIFFAVVAGILFFPILVFACISSIFGAGSRNKKTEK